MSATITTEHQHRVPLAASLAVAGVIAAAGVVGVVWQQSDSATTDQAPALRTPTAQDYSKYDYYHGARPNGGLDGGNHTPPDLPTTAGGRVQIGQ